MTAADTSYQKILAILLLLFKHTPGWHIDLETTISSQIPSFTNHPTIYVIRSEVPQMYNQPHHRFNHKLSTSLFCPGYSLYPGQNYSKRTPKLKHTTKYQGSFLANSISNMNNPGIVVRFWAGASRPTIESTQPSTQQIPGNLPGCKAGGAWNRPLTSI